MSCEIAPLCECFVAVVTDMRFFSGVGLLVSSKMTVCPKALITEVTGVWLLPSVDSPVSCKGSPSYECFAAVVTDIRFLSGVDLLVFSKIAICPEALITEVTGVWLLPSVDSPMSCKGALS